MPKYISLVDVAGRGMKNAICTLVRENYISNMADKTFFDKIISCHQIMSYLGYSYIFKTFFYYLTQDNSDFYNL